MLSEVSELHFHPIPLRSLETSPGYWWNDLRDNSWFFLFSAGSVSYFKRVRWWFAFNL